MNAGLVKGQGFAVDASVMEADASRYHGKAPDEIDWSLPERQTRAAAEFLASLDDEDPDADRKPPKVISPVDPCSAWTAKANKHVQFGYGFNYLIDIENAVIVDVNVPAVDLRRGRRHQTRSIQLHVGPAQLRLTWLMAAGRFRSVGGHDFISVERMLMNSWHFLVFLISVL